MTEKTSKIKYTKASEMMPTDDASKSVLIERARQLATYGVSYDANLNVTRYVKFSLLTKAFFGVNFDNLRSIIIGITMLKQPVMDKNVIGIINYRGTLISVIDLSKIIGIKNDDESEEKKLHSVVIVEANNSVVAFSVLKIIGIDQYKSGELQEPFRTDTTQESNNVYLGIHNNSTSIIDVEAIISKI